jgi:hypothetical protein
MGPYGARGRAIAVGKDLEKVYLSVMPELPDTLNEGVEEFSKLALVDGGKGLGAAEDPKEFVGANGDLGWFFIQERAHTNPKYASQLINCIDGR